jgi:hypothetical protein
MNQLKAMADNSGSVLIKATCRNRSALDLSLEELLAILQTPTIEGLKPTSETGKRAASLIWIYQRLYAYIGGDVIALRHWLRSQNRFFGACPLDILTTDTGLERVSQYLSSPRP